MTGDRIEVAVERPSKLGEGAFWDHSTGLLHWVDIDDWKFFAYDPRTGDNREWLGKSFVGTIVPAANGDLVVAVHHEVVRVNPATGATTLLARIDETRPEVRFNDGKCDPAGRLWVGTTHMGGQREQAALYRIETDGTAVRMVGEVSISNGVVWSLDGRQMHYIDSGKNDVRTFDFDLTSGEISNERVAFRNEHGGCFDGMTIDAEGKLWIAIYGVGEVRRYDPDTGRVLQTISFPVKQITSCAFGGQDLADLYITSAREGFKTEDAKQQPLAGSLFRVSPGVKGVPLPQFRG